jgi:hypothetical protein
MEMFEQVWTWISTAVVVLIIPLVTSLIKDADPKRVERWGFAKTLLLRIFSASTTRSSQTGEAQFSAPIVGNPVHPDDRKKK